ncbi:iron ABC transporter permease [Agrobacterium sp. V1]|uniref:FecCD family ABC transporter permease n=1 Tax=Agrobacterium sp. V1 TaxID=3061957 RepID=UPI002673811B|nr:iron ABC transporter permease [Agrobacterium sp. V1]MDO3445466.1 iron ABC transporter permease [Agrobacterium sp. V1]
MTLIAGSRLRVILIVLCCGLILSATLLLGLSTGARHMSFGTILDAVRSRADDEASLILWDIRLPRVMLAALVGAALAISGGIIQSVTRNPLGDPGLLGINAGAGLAIIMGTGFLGTDIVSSPFWLAAIGAGLAAFTVQALAGIPTPMRLTLAGIAVGAFCFGLTQAIALVDPDRFDLVRNWRAASLAAATVKNVVASLWMFGPGFLLALWIAPRISLIALGDERAASLGVSVNRTRLISLITVMLLAGGSTAASGPIAFIGLAAPHIARRAVRAGEGLTLAVAAFIGAELVILADAMARTAVAPDEIPISVVIAVLGAPFLIFMARRRQPTRQA